MHSTTLKLLQKDVLELSDSQSATYVINWVIGHSPIHVFEETSKAFAQRVEKRTDGEVAINVLSSKDYAGLAGAEDISREYLNELIISGKIQMAHNYTSVLGMVHPRMWTMELPFLFKDYKHAEKVVESPFANQMMSGMLQKGVRGLAFAYSGGLRVIPSVNTKISSLDDFKGLRIRTSGSDPSMAIMKQLKAKPIGAPFESVVPMAKAGKIAASDITYVRYETLGWHRTFPIINETAHSLFTTATVINERFFQSLPEEFQRIISEESLNAAREERQVAIREEQQVRKRCQEEGIEIVPFPKEQKALFIEKMKPVYEQFMPQYGRELIDAIRRAG